MSRLEKRLNELYWKMTALERGILALREMKEGRSDDLRLQSAIPPEQVEDYNRYVHLMNTVNSEFWMYLVFIRKEVEGLAVHLRWLNSLLVWAMTSSRLGDYIARFTREPVTQSEYEQRGREARQQMVPASELVETLVERHEEWTGDDREPEERRDGEPGVTAAARARAVREREREIARLVEDGVLVGKRKGRRLLVNAGSFYDWLGEPVPVSPEWGSGYEIFPDEQTGEVEYLRVARRHAQKMSEVGPRDIPVGKWLEAESPLLAGSRERALPGDAMVGELLAKLLTGIFLRSRELRAIEMVIQGVAKAFSGEDPLVSEVRDILDSTREGIEKIREEMQQLVGEFEVPEPDENMVAGIRSIFEYAYKRVL